MLTSRPKFEQTAPQCQPQDCESKDVAEKPVDKGHSNKMSDDSSRRGGRYRTVHEAARTKSLSGQAMPGGHAKLADLKTLINQSEQPDKVKLLREMYRARGDEQIEWNDDDPLSDPRATRTMPKYEIPLSDENGCPRVGM